MSPRADVDLTPSSETERSLQLLAFDTAGERFALESSFVRAVVPAAERRSIPGQPFGHAGLGFLSSDVASPIFDLGAVLRAPHLSDSSRYGWILAVGRARVELGLLSESEPRWRRVTSLAKLPWRLADADRELLLGVTDDGVLVVDGAVLLDDPRFRVAAAGSPSAEGSRLEWGAA